MARIRTIKPEFFTSEDIVSMTPLARLFYVSLWCESDREGRLEWKPGTFKMRYFPGDKCNICDLGNELIENGLIVLYEVEGKKYAEIPTFTEHQVINNRECESILPVRTFDASCTRESGVSVEGKEGRKGKERKEGKGREPSFDVPDDIADPLWQDFLKVRKAKRLALTNTGITAIRREAEKAGLSFSDAIQLCCEYGWGAFDAGWYAERKAKSAPRQTTNKTHVSFKASDDAIARARWEQMTGRIHPDNPNVIEMKPQMMELIA